VEVSVLRGWDPKVPVGSPVSFPKRSNPAWRLVAPSSPCRINTKSKHQIKKLSLQGLLILAFAQLNNKRLSLSREEERRLLLSWEKAGKDSKGRNKATRSEGDDLGDSAARALIVRGE